MMIVAQAPAKIILSGEHAVVYGYPAIAMPVHSLRATATITPLEKSETIRFNLPDLKQEIIGLRDKNNPIVRLTRSVLNRVKIDDVPAIRVDIQSQIPVASGLGSGAAVSTALAKALFQYFEYQPTLQDINAIVYDIEKMHHGTPSGIDNTVIVYESPVYFVRETPVKVMTIDTSLHLIIANTGKIALTKESVGDVRKLYNTAPDSTKTLLEQIGQCTAHIYEALQKGNMESIGKLMTENHTLLRDLTVSSPDLDNFVDVALHAGATGAKLSGGGRGGNMIALVNQKTAPVVKKALLAAGATQVFETQTGKST